MLTLKKYETGHGLISSALMHYKSTAHAQKIRIDDVLGVLNVRTCRFMRLNNKVHEQVSSDMLWIITYREWEEYRSFLVDKEKPTTRRTAAMIPQHPSGLSKEKLAVFVERCDPFGEKGDANSTLASVIEGYVGTPQTTSTKSEPPRRLSILNDESEISAVKKPHDSPASADSLTAAMTASPDEDMDTPFEDEDGSPNASPDLRHAEGLSPSGSTPSFIETTTPFIRKLQPINRNKPRGDPPHSPSYVPSATPDGYAADEGMEDREEGEDEEPSPLPLGSTGRAYSAPTAPTPAPTSAKKRPSVVKSVVLDDLGTHHLLSDVSDAGESVGVRSPSSVITATSPQASTTQSAALSPISVRNSDATEEDMRRLTDFLLPQEGGKRDAKLVALSSIELQALRGVTDAPLELVDYSATVTGLLARSVETGRHASISNGHLQDALSVAMARTKVLEEQLDTAIAEAKHHEGRALESEAQLQRERDAFSGVIKEEVAAAKEEASAMERGKHQDALIAVQDGHKARAGELEGQLEYYKQKLVAEKETFEKSLQDLRAENDRALSTLQREQEQKRAATVEEYEAKLADLRHHSDAKYSSLAELHEDRLTSHKTALEDRVSALQTLLEQERETTASKIAEVQAEHAAKLDKVQDERNQTISALRSAAEKKHKHVEEMGISKLQGHVDTYEEKIKTLQQALGEEKAAAEEKRSFLVSQHEEQLAVVKDLLSEEREASARALESHRQLSAERLSTLKEHSESTLEAKLLKVQQQLEDSLDLAEQRQRALAQEHAHTMSAAREAADKRYALLQEHHDEAIQAVNDHKQAVIGDFAGQLDVAKARQEELQSRLESQQREAQAKLDAIAEEHEQVLSRVKAHCEKTVALAAEQNDQVLERVQGVHAEKVALLEKALEGTEEQLRAALGTHETLVSSHAKKVDALEKEHAKTVEGMKHDHMVAMQRLETRHAAVVEEHNVAIEAIHSKHAEVVKEHGEVVTEMQKEFKEALDDHKNERREALETEVAAAVQKERELVAKHEEALAEQKSAFDKAHALTKGEGAADIVQLQEQHAKAVAAIKADSERILREALESADADRQKQVDSLEALHAKLMAKMQHEKAVAEEKLRSAEDMHSGVEEKYKHLHDLHLATKEQHAEHLETATLPIARRLEATEQELEDAKQRLALKDRDHHEVLSAERESKALSLQQERQLREEALQRKEEELHLAEEEWAKRLEKVKTEALDHFTAHEQVKLLHAEVSEDVKNKEAELLALQHKVASLQGHHTAMEERLERQRAAADEQLQTMKDAHSSQLEHHHSSYKKQIDALHERYGDSSRSESAKYEALRTDNEKQIAALKALHEEEKKSKVEAVRQQLNAELEQTRGSFLVQVKELQSKLLADHNHHEERYEALQKMYNRTVAAHKERVEDHAKSFREDKEKLEARQNSLKEDHASALGALKGKEEKLADTLKRLHEVENMLSVQIRAKASMAAEQKALEERCEHVQAQHQESAKAHEANKAFLTNMYEERIVTLQAQMEKERSSSTSKLESAEQSHKEAMLRAKNEEEVRREELIDENQKQLGAMRERYLKQIESERNEASAKISALQEQHAKNLDAHQVNMEAMMQQLRDSAASEKAAYENRIAFLQTGGHTSDIESLQTMHEKQIESLKEGHRKVLEAYREERNLFLADKEKMLWSEHEEALLRETTPLRQQIAALKQEVEEKEGLVADSKKRAEERVDFVSKQLKDAVAMQGSDLASVTFPQTLDAHGPDAGTNSSIVSHLIVDEDSEDEEDSRDSDAEEFEKNLAKFTGSAAPGEGVDGDAEPLPGGSLTSRSEEVPPSTTNTKTETPDRRSTTKIAAEPLLATPSASTTTRDEDGSADTDPVEEALKRQAELMQEVKVLKQKLASVSASVGVPTSSTTTQVTSGGDTAVDVAKGSDSSSKLIVEVLEKELESTRVELWDCEVQKNAAKLKLTVVERKYQQILARMESKIVGLKDIHGRAKEVIQQEHSNKLDEINRRQERDVESLKKSHQEQVQQMHAKHADHLDEHKQREEEVQQELEQEVQTAEERRRELVKSHSDTLAAHEKKLYSMQNSWQDQEARLKRAISRMEAENKDLVAAVEEFRSILGKQGRYHPLSGSPRSRALLAKASSENNQYTNMFQWITSSDEGNAADDLLSRTAASPTRLQRWEAAEENARKRVEERRRNGEHVGESEIEQAAYAEYCKASYDGESGADMDNYDPYADNSVEMAQGLQLPVIYDNVVPDDQSGMTDNPLLADGASGSEGGQGAMVPPRPPSVSAPAESSRTVPTVAKLSAKEQLVLEVEREIERAKAAWHEEMRLLERECMDEIDSLRTEINRLNADNARIPVLEKELAATEKLLDINRKSALEGIRHKHEKARIGHSARKFVSAWRHYVDEMHWMEVGDDGSKTPSKKQRHEEMRRQLNQSPFGVTLFE